ncbi:MAG: MOSC domain-containing protein [Myxococcota bacterium]
MNTWYLSPMRVVSLTYYPLKSAAGVTVDRAAVTRRGLAHDRRWMLTRPDGEFITARRFPQILGVQATVTAQGLRCSDPDGELNVTYPNTQVHPVTVWASHTTARDAGDEAADWFSRRIEVECRLVYQSEDDLRPVPPRPETRADDIVSFADGFPLLVIGTASLLELNRRIARPANPIGMERFRPNVVVETTTPFEEDAWTAFSIGECTFVNAKPCARCVLTTVDPVSLRQDPDGEPLKTLSRFRRDPDEKRILFGVNVVPRRLGELAFGDAVRIPPEGGRPPHT